MTHALTFFQASKFTQRLSAKQVAELHAVFDDAGALQSDDTGEHRRDAGDARRVRVERGRNETTKSLRVVVANRSPRCRPRRSPRRSPRRERSQDSQSPERASRHAKRLADESVPGKSTRPRRAERSPPRKAEPAPAPSRSHAPLEVRYDHTGSAPAAAAQPAASRPAAYALDEFVPLPTGSPARSPSPQPPRAVTALAVRPAIGGSVRPELLLKDEEPPAGAEEQGTYRTYMLREALRPVRSELAAIRAMHDSGGEERARATRHLLAKYHPSQAGAAVQNPALQWLYSEITKVITQTLS